MLRSKIAKTPIPRIHQDNFWVAIPSTKASDLAASILGSHLGQFRCQIQMAYMKPQYIFSRADTLTGKNALETHYSVSFNVEWCKQPPLCREPAPIPRTSRYLSSYNAAKWRSKRCSTYWSTTFPLQRSTRGPRWSWRRASRTVERWPERDILVGPEKYLKSYAKHLGRLFDSTNTTGITMHSPGAAHSGGSCQVAFSYDKGETWVVVYTWEGNCPRVVAPGTITNIYDVNQDYTFTIPGNFPTGHRVIFAWCVTQ
jgi:hypothetical protein